MSGYVLTPTYLPYPTEPTGDNTHRSIADAAAAFRGWQHYGEGPAEAYLHYADEWDGISYGDSRFAILTIGPRGGVRIEWPW